jgi:hypothetical protein
MQQQERPFSLPQATAGATSGAHASASGGEMGVPPAFETLASEGSREKNPIATSAASSAKRVTPSTIHPMCSPAARRWQARPLATVVPLLFPLAILLFATYFLFGRIGFWSDDYWHNLRNPVTGHLGESLIISREFFLRPLFYRIVPALTTLLWNHDWAAHLLQILAHAAVSLLLYTLLRTLAAPARAAAAGALLFMVFPPHFEAVLWFSALPTSLATAMMLAMMFITVGMARRSGALGPLGGWCAVPLMMAMAFAICCLNEQPAAGIFALPLVYALAWITRERDTLTGRFEPSASGALRALLPAFLCGVMVIVYTWLVVATAIPGSRGHSGNFVSLQQLWPRTVYFADVLWRRLVMKNFAAGALRLGTGELRAAPLAVMAWSALLIATFIPFARWWVGGPRTTPPPPSPREPRDDDSRQPQSSSSILQPLLLAFTGLVIFATGFLPIMIFAVYDPDSRTRYWPAVGLAMVIAAAGALWGRPGLRPAALVALGAILLYSSIILVGVQAAFRTRWMRDQAEAAQLRALLPEPDPYSFFIPLRIEGWAVQTGSPVLDAHFRGAWEFPWSAPRHIAFTYQRTDVRCGYFRHWSPRQPVRGADELGIHYTDRLGPRYPAIEGSGSRIPWDLAIPFIITRDGDVRIVTRIIIEGDPGADVRVPQAQHLPELEATLPRH